MKWKSKWHQVGLSLFNYQDDARSNKHKMCWDICFFFGCDTTPPRISFQTFRDGEVVPRGARTLKQTAEWTQETLTISIPVYDFKWLILNVIENCVIHKNVTANLLENGTASNKLRYGQYMKTGMNFKFTRIMQKADDIWKCNKIKWGQPAQNLRNTEHILENCFNIHTQ